MKRLYWLPIAPYRYFFESERGLFPNTEFVFDLELPVDFVPGNNDGEVDGFELIPRDKVSFHYFPTGRYFTEALV